MPTEKLTLEEIAERLLAQFAWKQGRDRQRADAWAAYQQDVLGGYSQQVSVIVSALREAVAEGPASCDVAGCPSKSIRCGEHIRQQIVEAVAQERAALRERIERYITPDTALLLMANLDAHARESAEPSKPEPPALPLGHEFVRGWGTGCHAVVGDSPQFCGQTESAHKPAHEKEGA